MQFYYMCAGDAAANERPQPEAQHAGHVRNDHQLFFWWQEACQIQGVLKTEIVLRQIDSTGSAATFLYCCRLCIQWFPSFQLSFLVDFSYYMNCVGFSVVLGLSL